MRKSGFIVCVAAAALLGSGLSGSAQETKDAAATAAPEDGLLTAAELQKLVAPVALYPDTVLIQILIAATAPLDVVKADRVLRDNTDTPSADLEQLIKDASYDPSVEVLAIAFPELIAEMAVHIDWTEAAGNAMLAQSDDVLAAVQVMRAQAMENGVLASSPEQVVSTDPETSAIIVQPADPEVVYVPQYDSTVVYSDPVGDALTTGLIVFGTVALIDEIFEDDDDWDDYWGCRNCGGWDDSPIISNPDVDIDINGDVNIGNDVDIGGGWKPDNDRVVVARDRMAKRRGDDGTLAGIERPANRADELRTKLGGSAEVRPADLKRDRADIDRETKLRDRTPAAKRVSEPKSKVKPEPRVKKTSKEVRKKPKIAKTDSARRTKESSRRGAVVKDKSSRRKPR